MPGSPENTGFTGIQEFSETQKKHLPVSVRENDKGEKVFEIDDSAGKRREAFNLQMEQMMEAPGMEPD